MSAALLRSRVIAARAERGWTPAELQRRSGLSARTIRDIESANRARRYGATTLAKLDRALEWQPGTALASWLAGDGEEDAQLASMRSAIAEQMAALEQRLARIEESPPWQAELVDACRLLSPEDRARVLDYVRRLGR